MSYWDNRRYHPRAPGYPNWGPQNIAAPIGPPPPQPAPPGYQAHYGYPQSQQPNYGYPPVDAQQHLYGYANTGYAPYGQTMGHPPYYAASQYASWRPANASPSSHQQKWKIQPPNQKKKRKDRLVSPPERLTIDPVVRAPISDVERKEVDQWIADRKKSFPTAQNVARKSAEAEARKQRGELDPIVQDSRMRLRDVLSKQKEMGILRKAGTEELFEQVVQTYPGRRGGANRGRGRGRGGGRGKAKRGGWESFMSSGEAPEKHKLENGDEEQNDSLKRSKKSGSNDEKTECYKEVQKQKNKGGLQHQNTGKKPRQPCQMPPPAPPSLLEKLLAKEIHQDHSYLLQAFRFFIENKYLLHYDKDTKLKFTEQETQHLSKDTLQVELEESVSLEDSDGTSIST